MSKFLIITAFVYKTFDFVLPRIKEFVQFNCHEGSAKSSLELADKGLASCTVLCSQQPKQDRHLVTTEDLRIFYVRMAENSQPGQLVQAIMMKTVRPVSMYCNRSSPSVKQAKLVSQDQLSAHQKTGSRTSSLSNKFRAATTVQDAALRARKQGNHQITRTIGLSHAANVSISSREGIMIASTRRIATPRTASAAATKYSRAVVP